MGTGTQDSQILRCDGAQLSGGTLLPGPVGHIYELWVNQDAYDMSFSRSFQSSGTCNWNPFQRIRSKRTVPESMMGYQCIRTSSRWK